MILPSCRKPHEMLFGTKPFVKRPGSAQNKGLAAGLGERSWASCTGETHSGENLEHGHELKTEEEPECGSFHVAHWMADFLTGAYKKKLGTGTASSLILHILISQGVCVV